MQRRDRDAQSGIDQPLERQAWLLPSVADDGHIGPSCKEPRKLVLIKSFVESEVDRTVLLPVALDGFHDEKACARKKAHGEVALLAEPRGSALLEGARQPFEGAGRVRLQDFTGSREANTSPDTNEEVNTERLLEASDAAAERRLGDVESVCRSTEMELLGRDQEVPEQPRITTDVLHVSVDGIPVIADRQSECEASPVPATEEPRSSELGGAATDPALGTVLTVQELRVEPVREQEFIERFRRLDVLRLAGGVSDLAEAVLVHRDDHFEVVSIWPSETGIEAWIRSPERVHVREALEPLYSEPPRVTRYEALARYSAGRS